jgi:hypothetical protein
VKWLLQSRVFAAWVLELGWEFLATRNTDRVLLPLPQTFSPLSSCPAPLPLGPPTSRNVQHRFGAHHSAMAVRTRRIGLTRPDASLWSGGRPRHCEDDFVLRGRRSWRTRCHSARPQRRKSAHRLGFVRGISPSRQFHDSRSPSGVTERDYIWPSTPAHRFIVFNSSLPIAFR